ncbi:MAG: UDP-N-acetylmuramoyl-L-alanyl-D-glutamate--2,6-diaminopimelate ligase [Nitrospirae bacterium]|nr:UDP-N-acetylmuramoyl-L-alanyl-D-glutamate--2,6-diaminopimelate ligase [Candidatus Troglogloeales bacterium]MBI3598024.1 UDP-N-acetylmuramoyl-L-alanyl-D-glutamate--2,6-diaminopimelate ligase [Candidatus Troglogloeales bacterium]
MKLVVGEAALEIDQIVTDSRKATKGSLFVALPGTQNDGRKFIKEAVSRGAVAVVAEKEVEGKRTPFGQETTIEVQDAHEALFKLASQFFRRPTHGLHLVGITGTNGKTTTAFLAQSLLKTYGRKTGLLGTIHYDLGDENQAPLPFKGRQGGDGIVTASQTTPGILELQSLFADMRKRGTTDVVMEVSSHSLDQKRVFGLSFDTAVFTNLTQDHLDYHKTMDAYFEAKKKLFRQTTGLCVINVDDPWGMELKRDLSERTLCYGIDNHQDIYPRSISLTLQGIQMAVTTPIGELEITSALTGQYNVYNILGAIGVGVATGLSKESISTGIAAMKSVPGRFEKIDLGQDFLVIVDYAHTEDALSRLLQSVSSLALGHVITVVGCGGDRDRGKRPKMGEVASLYSRLSILTSDNPRSEPPLSIIKEMETGMLNKTPKPMYEIIPDRGEAIVRAISLAETGDAVVIAGKGHEQYQIIGDRIIRFDDREVARLALSERKGLGKLYVVS